MTTAHTVCVGELDIGNDLPLTVIAGPCAMESRAHALEMGQALKEIADRVGFGPRPGSDCASPSSSSFRAS